MSAARRKYLAKIGEVGDAGPHVLIAAVIQRAVEDAKGNTFALARYGPRETRAMYEARRRAIIAEARDWLRDDAYLWTAFMPNPDRWDELLEALA